MVVEHFVVSKRMIWYDLALLVELSVAFRSMSSGFFGRLIGKGGVKALQKTSSDLGIEAGQFLGCCLKRME